jgi:hypothetical protein
MGFLRDLANNIAWIAWWTSALLTPALVTLLHVSSPQKSGRS